MSVVFWGLLEREGEGYFVFFVLFVYGNCGLRCGGGVWCGGVVVELESPRVIYVLDIDIVIVSWQYRLRNTDFFF